MDEYEQAAQAREAVLAEHAIDPHEVDMFFDGRTGMPLTDEQWDEQKRRLIQDNTHLVPEQFRGV